MMEIKLEGVRKTLLIPLWSRAKLLDDPKAREIIADIGYDFDKTEKNIPHYVKLMLSVRAKEIDDIIKNFITRRPGATIVNLGAGLDTAFYRVDNGSIKWIDIDLPDVIELRKRLLPETDRSGYIAGSIFDREWIKGIPEKSNGVLFISCGVLPYFEEILVKGLLKSILENFSGSEMAFDTQSKLGNFIANTGAMLRGMRSAALLWGIKDASKIEKWNSGIKLLKQYPLFSRTERDQEVRNRGVSRIMDFSDKFKLANIVRLKMGAE
ncbi:MAG: class I SAM-dependent methyltransferase [Brevinematales bacterium]|jgi:O-methyltransferase involved in polyketide biosynthesis